MNDPQTTRTGLAMLKDNYEAPEQGRNALTEALRMRRKRLAQTRLGSMHNESPEVLNDISGLNLPGRGL